MGVTLRFNKIPDVIKALPRQANDAVDDSAEQIAETARNLVPKDKTILMKETKADTTGDLHAVVNSGVYRGHGFYAGFVEHGAAQPGGKAQPYMTPAAHEGEVVLEQKMTAAVKRACDV
jgi:HK97 gp10 family phage protein